MEIPTVADRHEALWAQNGPSLEEAGLDSARALIHDQLLSSHSNVHAAMGDDAASVQVPRGHELIMTNAVHQEHIHYRRAWLSPREAGSRVARVSLANIASMGGTPWCAIVSLSAGRNELLSSVLHMIRGVMLQLTSEGASVIRVHLDESSGGTIMDVVLLGLTRSGRTVRCDGACEGDAVYVSGCVGESGATVRLLERDRPTPVRWSNGRYRRPEPRLALGRILAENLLASAMKNISTGLGRDADGLARASAVGMEVSASSIPLAPGLLEISEQLEIDVRHLALCSSEDQELLFTVHPEHEARLKAMVKESRLGVPISKIGRCVAGNPGLVVNDINEPTGLWPWNHPRFPFE